MRRPLLCAGLAAALLVGACGGTGPSSGPPSSAVPPASSPAIVIPSFSPGPTIPMPSGAQSLMALLPTAVAGVAVTLEPQSLAEAVADQAFVASVDRAAFPIAVSGSDLVSGVVAHIRAGVYSDKMFTDWRASYDEGACASSAGVLDRPGGSGRPADGRAPGLRLGVPALCARACSAQRVL